MNSLLTRRGFTAAGFAAIAVGHATSARADGGAAIAALERQHGGRLGVFVQDTGTGRTLAHRADERFLLQSTFKGPLAAMVFTRVEAGQDDLAHLVPYGTHDLLPASPITTAHVSAGALTVGTLVKAILERSDNTAANLLLRRVGGPPALTAWLRSLGDTVTNSSRYEVLGGWSGTKDTTTPRAIAATAARISLGDVLRPPMRALNNRWMAANVVGARRLRAGLPPNWTTSDRTGTSDTICNDYAVAWPPGHPPLVIAAYYEKPDLDMDDGEALFRAVGAMVVSWAAHAV
ncbi:MAG: class A beta-lactamase [Janthinobacterium lividum]